MASNTERFSDKHIEMGVYNIYFSQFGIEKSFKAAFSRIPNFVEAIPN